MRRVGNLVPQLIQRLHNDTKRPPPIVTLQVFDVLQNKNRRLTGGDNPDHVKKQRPLRFAGKAVSATKGILLRHAGERKRLAGEAGQ